MPGLEKLSRIADLANPYPLSYVEQITLMEATVEMSTSCYAGVLMLQALGLGGWMYNGIDRHAIFGISGDPEASGLGFESRSLERYAQSTHERPALHRGIQGMRHSAGAICLRYLRMINQDMKREPLTA